MNPPSSNDAPVVDVTAATEPKPAKKPRARKAAAEAPAVAETPVAAEPVKRAPRAPRKKVAAAADPRQTLGAQRPIRSDPAEDFQRAAR